MSNNHLILKSMSDKQFYVLLIFIFKIFIIACGMAAVYLGYRLFTRPLPPAPPAPDGSEVTTEVGKYRLVFRNVAPGVFFCVLGCAIIGFVGLKGFRVVDGDTMVEGAAPDDPSAFNNEDNTFSVDTAAVGDTLKVVDTIKKADTINTITVKP